MDRMRCTLFKVLLPFVLIFPRGHGSESFSKVSVPSLLLHMHVVLIDFTGSCCNNIDRVVLSIAILTFFFLND